MSWVIALAVGLAAGTHIATWGMYKDSPHEGFTVRRYSRSILLAALAALAVQALARLDLMSAGGIFVLFGTAYCCERAAVEFWKTFLREEDQSKYSIPMQFAVKGNVVHRRAARLLVGAAVVGGVLLLGAGILALAELPWPGTAVLVVVGSVGGWVSALGGAWKDAPIEGFETAKFFRSPVIAAVYGFILTHFTDSYVLVPLGALGYTIATLETYKTFFFPSRPRGKFAGKPVLFPEMLRTRNAFVPVYVAIWAGVAATLVMGLR